VRYGGLLLLTGTPVQNNTKEIFSLLNLLDQNEFDSEEDFLRKYGDIKAAEQTSLNSISLDRLKIFKTIF
jgi:chromodomain-helicase-DNA-binding protein 7